MKFFYLVIVLSKISLGTYARQSARLVGNKAQIEESNGVSWLQEDGGRRYRKKKTK